MRQTWLTPTKKKRAKAICASPVAISDGIVTVKFSEENRPFNWGLKGPLNRMVPNSSGEQPEGKVATGHGVIPMTNPASIVDWMNSWIRERTLLISGFWGEVWRTTHIFDDLNSQLLTGRYILSFRRKSDSDALCCSSYSPNGSDENRQQFHSSGENCVRSIWWEVFTSSTSANTLYLWELFLESLSFSGRQLVKRSVAPSLIIIELICRGFDDESELEMKSITEIWRIYARNKKLSGIKRFNPWHIHRQSEFHCNLHSLSRWRQKYVYSREQYHRSMNDPRCSFLLPRIS